MISTKGRYALRLMLDLATQESADTEYVPLKDIASRQGISEKYMEIIIKELVKNKLIIGLRGKGGGYKLTRKPEEYPVGEILEAAGEQLAPVACFQILNPAKEKMPAKPFPCGKSLTGYLMISFMELNSQI